MGWQRGAPEVPKLGVGESYTFNNKITGTRLAVEWIATNGIICDLDIYVLFYDERVSYLFIFILLSYYFITFITIIYSISISI